MVIRLLAFLKKKKWTSEMTTTRARARVCVHISSFKTVDLFSQKDAGINGMPLQRRRPTF